MNTGPASPSSADLLSRAQRRIPGGVNSPVRAFRAVGGDPFFTGSASGCRLRDVDGREYLDCVGAWGPAILGHAHPAVVRAIADAAARGVSFGTPNPLEVEMAETLCRLVPSLGKVRMVNSGTEATMACVRLARGFTGRDLVVKFAGCYHGHVDPLLVRAGSGALTHGEPDSAGVPRALAALTLCVEFNDPDALAALFAARGAEIAAVILEPIPANAGLYLPAPGFLATIRTLCTRYGSLLIFDEVMTGLRVAPGGAQQLYGVCPDLTALGKVIGGGLPVGAFGGRADVMDRLSPEGPVYQAGTLSGNPLALAAGLAQIRELEKTDGWGRLERLGARLEDLLRPLLERQRPPLTLHRVGSMFCLFFHPGPISRLSDIAGVDLPRFARFFRACLDRGLFLPPSQYETAFLSLAHAPGDLEFLAGTVGEALRASAAAG